MCAKSNFIYKLNCFLWLNEAWNWISNSNKNLMEDFCCLLYIFSRYPRAFIYGKVSIFFFSRLMQFNWKFFSWVIDRGFSIYFIGLTIYLLHVTNSQVQHCSFNFCHARFIVDSYISHRENYISKTIFLVCNTRLLNTRRLLELLFIYFSDCVLNILTLAL